MSSYGRKPQSQPLAYSGVPENQQVQVPFPEQQFQPVTPPPSQVEVQAPVRDYQANFQDAAGQVAGQENLAAERYPEQNTASILATLSGIAGNIAGVLSGRGAVGAPGIQLGQQIQENQRRNQDQFTARVRQSEEQARRDELELEKAQNLQLQANSLVPLVNRIPDPQTQAYIYSKMAAGEIEAADTAVKQYWAGARQVHQDAENRQYKEEMSQIRADNLEQRKINDELNNRLKDIKLATAERDFVLKPRKEQEKIVRQETTEYNRLIAKVKEPLSTYVTIEETLGGLDSPEGRQKISRLLGLMGGLRAKVTGTPEDKRLAQNIQRLFATMKTEDFGTSFTASEKSLMESASGVALSGGLFSNVFKTPDQFIEGLRTARKGLTTKLAAAAANKQPETLKGFETEGAPLTLRSFTAAIDKARLGSTEAMDAVPAGVNPDDWVRMDRATRALFHQQKGQ